MRMIPGSLASAQGLGTGVLISQIDETKIEPVLGGQLEFYYALTVQTHASLSSVGMNYHLGSCVFII